MDFTEMLATYIGQTIEVYQTNQFFTGQLLGVGSNSFVVRVVSDNYAIPTTDLTVLISSVEYVRVLTAAA